MLHQWSYRPLRTPCDASQCRHRYLRYTYLDARVLLQALLILEYFLNYILLAVPVVVSLQYRPPLASLRLALARYYGLIHSCYILS